MTFIMIIIIIVLHYSYSVSAKIVEGKFVDDTQQKLYVNDHELFVPYSLNIEKGTEHSKQVGSEIYSYFFGNGSVTNATNFLQVNSNIRISDEYCIV